MAHWSCHKKSLSLKCTDVYLKGRVAIFFVGAPFLPVILEAQAFKTMVLFGTRFANVSIPREEWKEVYGFLLGYKDNEGTLHIQSMIPFIHGSATEVRFGEEDYGLAEEVVNKAENAGLFIVGWYHTHPGLGLFLSDIDVLNHIGFQSVNPLAVAVVLDTALIAEAGYGFKVFALDDPEKGPTASPVEREFTIQGLDPTFIAATLIRVAQDTAFQKPLAPEFKEIVQSAGQEGDDKVIGEYFPPAPVPAKAPPIDITVVPPSNVFELENWAEPEVPQEVTARGGICSELDCVPSAEWEQWASQISNEQESLLKDLHDAEILGQPTGPIFEKLADSYLQEYNYDEAIRYLERAKQSYETMENTTAIVRLGIRIARVYYKRGFLDQAITILDELEEKYHPTDFTVRVIGLNTYAAIYQDLGEYDKSYTALTEALRIAKAADDARLVQGCLMNLAEVFLFLQNYKAGLEISLRALQFYRRNKDIYGESVALAATAELFFTANPGHASLAQQMLQQSLELKRRLDDKEGMVEGFTLLGRASIVQRDFQTAESYLFQALDLSRELQQPRFEGKVLETLGVLYFVKKNYVDADSYFDLAVEVYRDQLGNDLKVLELLQRQGNARKQANNFEKAVEIFVQARELARTKGSGAVEGQILFQLGMCYERLNNWESALNCFEEAQQIYLGVYDTASADQMGQQMERIRSRLA